MHHTKLFDHGILINRGSTDRSVEICKTFAPNWEIRNSKSFEFDAYLVDQEVMEIERNYRMENGIEYDRIPVLL